MLYEQILKNGHDLHKQQAIVQRMFKITQSQLIEEVTNLIGVIKDPQYSLTLQQLDIINPNSVTLAYLPISPTSTPSSTHSHIDNAIVVLTIEIKPTVPHCHLIQQIGLSIRLKLQQELPEQWMKKIKLRIKIQEGTHNQRKEMEKLMNDRERIAGAMENQEVMSFVKKLIQ